MERIEEIDHGLCFGDSIENARPKVSRSEIADGDWMETAWILRYELSDAFEEVMLMLRNRVEKHLEAANQSFVQAPEKANAGESLLDDDEESAI
jgi:hypothetical protein